MRPEIQHVNSEMTPELRHIRPETGTRNAPEFRHIHPEIVTGSAPEPRHIRPETGSGLEPELRHFRLASELMQKISGLKSSPHQPIVNIYFILAVRPSIRPSTCPFARFFFFCLELLSFVLSLGNLFNFKSV